MDASIFLSGPQTNCTALSVTKTDAPDPIAPVNVGAALASIPSVGLGGLLLIAALLAIAGLWVAMRNA